MSEAVILDKYIYTDFPDDEISAYIKALNLHFLSKSHRILIVGLNYKDEKYYEMRENQEIFRIKAEISSNVFAAVNLYFRANHLIKTLIKGRDIDLIFIFDPYLGYFIPARIKRCTKFMFLSLVYWKKRMNFLKKTFIKNFCLKDANIVVFSEEEKSFFEDALGREVILLQPALEVENRMTELEKRYVVLMAKNSRTVRQAIEFLDREALIKRELVLPRLPLNFRSRRIVRQHKVHFYEDREELNKYLKQAHTIINIDYAMRNDFLFSLYHLLKNTKVISFVQNYKELKQFPNFYYVRDFVQLKENLSTKLLRITKKLKDIYSPVTMAEKIEGLVRTIT